MFAGKHLVLVTDVEKADPEYAFDNPGFRGKCEGRSYFQPNLTAKKSYQTYLFFTEGTPVIRSKKQPVDTKVRFFDHYSLMVRDIV